jgi:hypothetical protein
MASQLHVRDEPSWIARSQLMLVITMVLMTLAAILWAAGPERECRLIALVSVVEIKLAPTFWNAKTAVAVDLSFRQAARRAAAAGEVNL